MIRSGLRVSFILLLSFSLLSQALQIQVQGVKLVPGAQTSFSYVAPPSAAFLVTKGGAAPPNSPFVQDTAAAAGSVPEGATPYLEVSASANAVSHSASAMAYVENGGDVINSHAIWTDTRPVSGKCRQYMGIVNPDPTNLAPCIEIQYTWAVSFKATADDPSYPAAATSFVDMVLSASGIPTLEGHFVGTDSICVGSVTSCGNIYSASPVGTVETHYSGFGILRYSPDDYIPAGATVGWESYAQVTADSSTYPATYPGFNSARVSLSDPFTVINLDPADLIIGPSAAELDFQSMPTLVSVQPTLNQSIAAPNQTLTENARVQNLGTAQLDNLTVGDELGDVLGCPSTTLACGGSEMCSGNFTAPIVPCLYGVGVIASGNETGNIVGGLGEVNVTVSAASAPLTTPGGS